MQDPRAYRLCVKDVGAISSGRPATALRASAHTTEMPIALTWQARLRSESVLHCSPGKRAQAHGMLNDIDFGHIDSAGASIRVRIKL